MEAKTGRTWVRTHVTKDDLPAALREAHDTCAPDKVVVVYNQKTGERAVCPCPDCQGKMKLDQMPVASKRVM